MKKNIFMSAVFFAIGATGLFAQIPDNRKTDPANPPADTVYRNSSSDSERRLEKDKMDPNRASEANPTTPPKKNDEMMDKQKKAQKRDSTMKPHSKAKTTIN